MFILGQFAKNVTPWSKHHCRPIWKFHDGKLNYFIAILLTKKAKTRDQKEYILAHQLSLREAEIYYI